MTLSNAQVERVVREVLADFELLSHRGVARPEAADEFSVTHRVVTLEHIEGRLDGLRRLLVPCGAVVTPAVRDELRRKGVTLSFGEAETTMPGDGARLILMVAGRSFDPESLVQGLRGEAVAVDFRRADCLIRATDELAGELAGELADGQTRAVLITAHPAAAACLANRHRGVRAVQGFDAGKIAADAASVGANLLAVDPAVTGPFLLKKIVTQFCSSGPVTCPSVFEERLG